MGEHLGDWNRHRILAAFEASCGDVSDDGGIPVFIGRGRATAVTLATRLDGDTLHARYTIHDRTLDDDDVLRLFAIAYLERFTCHYYQGTTSRIAFENAETGAVRTTAYPDRIWLEPEWNS